MIELRDTFPKEDAVRIEHCIYRLVPHLRPDEYAFVGGLAIRYHVLKAGLEYPARPFNDIDVIVERPETLGPQIGEDFIVTHNQSPNYWMMIEPETRTKVDAFDALSFQETVHVDYKDGTTLPLQTAESQLVKTVLDTRKVLHGEKVECKQFEDAGFLLRIADLDIANKYLEQLGVPFTVREVFDEALVKASKHPELLFKKPYFRIGAYITFQILKHKIFTPSRLEQFSDKLQNS